ncbi:putative transcription factor interactor and regulator LIM family [Medicago truncatula]|uniref:GATA type zinc finger transcription factor family protein n=1 Tax=Medicago truncatula TaxID=3880 RepID=A0A072TZG0_MEDTR|nr:GATA type zinc finger transcription factor family protein [Medicago truncatula]RHN39943.1 putative transcription factor interactor and regulator LIM family [Medicago truncatula]
MSFTGTLDKCKACDKTVYVVDLLTLENIPYHKSCFKCSHCKGNLTMSTYSSMDGILYCKTHFEQLFKESGNFSKNFAKSSDKANELNRTPSRLSSMFSGTLDKCATCSKTVYPLEKVTLEGEIYHKTCFRCAHAGCPLTHSNYAALDGVLYCRVHFAQLFMEKGNYSHVLKSAHKRNGSSSESVEVVEEPSQSAEAPQDHPEETS